MKKVLDFLKEYLSIIVLIPAFIGGLYQIINIVNNVGFSYIRYFSVAQVIPDGLLVGIFIIYIFMVIFIITELFRFFSINVDDFGGVKTKILLIIILLGIFILSSWRFMTSTPESVIGAMLGDFGWLNVIIVTGYGIAIILINISVTNDYEVVKSIYWGALIAYLLFFAYQLDNKIIIINESIIKDHSFYNSSILINKMIEKNPNVNLELVYANRDYLFFKIEKNGYKQILVEDAKKLTSLDDK